MKKTPRSFTTYKPNRQAGPARRQAGFSLVEIIMYIGIFSILLLIMTELFNTTLDVQLESTAVSSTQQDGRFLLSRLAYDISASQAILIPENNGEQSNILQLRKDGVPYTYSVVNDTLQLVNDAGADVLNSAETTVSNVTFRRIGNASGKPTVQVNFTITSKTQSSADTDTKTYQTTIGVR